MRIVLRHFAAWLPEDTRRGVEGLVWDYLRHQLQQYGCPAAYAALAANEAEKAADINILEVRAVGSFGRVYIGGEEKDVVVAHDAAVQAIKSVTGKTKKK